MGSRPDIQREVLSPSRKVFDLGPAPRESLAQLRLDCHLQHPVSTLTKNAVPFLDVGQRHTVCDQGRQINPAVSNHLDQASHAFFSSWAEGRDDTMISDASGECLVGDLQLSGVHAET